jgi:type II secretion system protein N
MASDSKNKNWLGYAAYFVVITVLLLYFLFPADSMEELLNSSVSRINPELSFKAEKIRPWIPAGLRIDSGQIYLAPPPEVAIFKSDNFYISPHILKFLKGEYSADLEGNAYKGEISGTLHFAAADKDIASEITFRDFALGEYDFLAAKFKHRVTGSLSGEIIYSNESAGTAGGSGNIDLRLSDGRLQFKAPVFNIASLDLQSIKFEAKLNRREIAIVKAELQGSEVNGSMTGSIKLRKDIRQSQLNLRGTLEPLAQFYQNYPEIRELLKTMKKRVKRGQYFFTVTGTIGAPSFKLL